jgi:hypothetical protein
MITLQPGDENRGIALMFMACFSVGIIEIWSLTLAPLAVPSEDLGVALGALGSIRTAGASVATANYVTILSNRLVSEVPKLVRLATVVSSQSHNLSTSDI